LFVVISYPPVHAIFGVSPHGILAAAGGLAGAVLLMREVRRRGADTAPLERALLWAVPAGIVGARADYVISHPHEFSSLGQVLALWHGGLALFGGLIAGLSVGVIVAHRAGIYAIRLLDAAAPSIALAIAVGRIGDLLLLDHLGKPAASAWALAYRVQLGSQLAPGFGPSPAIAPPSGASCADVGKFYAGCSYHLSAGYDLLGSVLLLALLLLLRRRGGYHAGVMFSVWALWYGTQRLALDFTRGVDERPLAGLTGTQLLAIGVLTLAIGSLSMIGLRHRGWGEQPGEPCSRAAPLQRAPQHDHSTPAPIQP
jgi:phosphatidylglycerol:prolipoprotein diacylglycerol transferase